MKENSKLVPEIRFSGFTDAWEQRKLGEVKDVRDGTHSSPVYVKQGHALVTSKNLTDYDLDLSNVSFISDEDFKLINQRSKVDIGDIIFGMIGTIGNPVLLTRDDFAIKNVALLKNDGVVENTFLVNLLKSPIFQAYVREENAGGTQKFIGLNQIRNFIFLSPDTNEQIKIGSFFKQLDNIVALYERKLTSLKQLKSGYLTKIFNQEVRFSGFYEDWEERKLADVSEVIMGQSPSSENYTSIDTNHILVQGNADMKYGRVFPRVWTTKVTKQAKAGDLILSVRAPVGDIGKTDYDVVLGRGVAAIKGNEFIFQKLILMKMVGYWNKYSTGSTFESINSIDIKKAILIFPVQKEQMHIGSFLQQLDLLIAQQERKIIKLKEIKKAYLEKLFI